MIIRKDEYVNAKLIDNYMYDILQSK